MRTLTRSERDKLTPTAALDILRKGNERFQSNIRINRNLLQQVNDTQEGQSPFAVIVSCMDSRTSAELTFDQGLGDIFSVRIAGNIINEEILGSAEFGCKVIGAKVLLIVGHSGCGAIKGALDHVELGHLGSVTKRIQRAIPRNDLQFNHLDAKEKLHHLTLENIRYAVQDVREQSPILRALESDGQLLIAGAVYNISTGKVDFDLA